MWAHDFLNGDPVAKTYVTHLKANNLFGRWWFQEYYLRDRSRSGALLRGFRLFIALCLYLIICCHIVSDRDWQYGALCMHRLDCKISCVLENFPNLSCFLKKSPLNTNVPFAITYAGNRYDKLYDFRLASDAQADVTAFNACKRVVDPAQLTSSSSEDAFLHDKRLPRTQVCFPNCRGTEPAYPGQSLFGEQYNVHAGIAVNAASLTYATSSAAVAAASWSAGKIPTNVTVSGNVVGTNHLLSGDDRPSCTQDDGNGGTSSVYDENHLICVDDTERCEKVVFKNEICLGASSSSSDGAAAGAWCFTLEHVIVCMAVALPALFLYNVLIYYTTVLNPEEDLETACLKCGMQWVVSVVSLGVILYTAAVLVKVAAFGRVPMVFLTWFVLLVVDQVRNLVVQTVLWYALIRRFGQVPVMNESEWLKTLATISPDDASLDESANVTPLQILQRLAIRCLEWRAFDLMIYSILGLYAVFLLTLIAIQDYLSKSQVSICEDVDTVFLGLFAMEIVVRVLATGMQYFLDAWNLFDFGIVAVSWVFAIERYANPDQATSSTTLALLRLLRLLRLVNGLRKLTASNRKKNNKQSGLSFSSPVERVLEILREARQLKAVPNSLKEEVTWSMEIVSSNKLYSISVEDRSSGKQGDSFMEQEVADWVRLVSDSSSLRQNHWDDDALEKFLVGQTKRKEWRENLEQSRKRLIQFLEDEVSVNTSELIALNSATVPANASAISGGSPTIMPSPSGITGAISLGRSQMQNVVPGNRSFLPGGQGQQPLPLLGNAGNAQFGQHAQQQQRMNPQSVPAELFIEHREHVGLTSDADYALYLESKLHSYILRTLEVNLHSWDDFNIYQFASFVGEDDVLPLVFAECFIFHELTAALEMSLDPVLVYMRALTRGYINENPYHNALHAADVLQGFHVMLVWLQCNKGGRQLPGNAGGEGLGGSASFGANGLKGARSFAPSGSGSFGPGGGGGMMLGESGGGPGGGTAGTDLLSSYDVLAGLFAAAIHDYQHPGVSNAFLVRTKHPIALRYNDMAVLENHHVSWPGHISAAFHLMLQLAPVGGDLFATLSETQYQQVRKTVIAIVLATDTSAHFAELSTFKTKLLSAGVSVTTGHGVDYGGRKPGEGGGNNGGAGAASGSGGGPGSVNAGNGAGNANNSSNAASAGGNNNGNNSNSASAVVSRAGSFPDPRSAEDKQILLNILVHAADISNACRVGDIYGKHVQRTMEEFFRQGDIEKDKNLPVSMFFDRESTSTPKCQLAFIDVVVLPLFTVLGGFLPEVSHYCLENLWANRAHVQAQELALSAGGGIEASLKKAQSLKKKQRETILEAIRERMRKALFGAGGGGNKPKAGTSAAEKGEMSPRSLAAKMKAVGASSANSLQDCFPWLKKVERAAITDKEKGPGGARGGAVESGDAGTASRPAGAAGGLLLNSSHTEQGEGGSKKQNGVEEESKAAGTTSRKMGRSEEPAKKSRNEKDNGGGLVEDDD